LKREVSATLLCERVATSSCESAATPMRIARAQPLDAIVGVLPLPNQQNGYAAPFPIRR
jgi:hypothetical protein